MSRRPADNLLPRQIQACSSNAGTDLNTSQDDADVTMVDANDCSAEADCNYLNVEHGGVHEVYQDYEVDEDYDAEEAAEDMAATGSALVIDENSMPQSIYVMPQHVAGNDADPEKRIFVVSAWSNYGFNKAFNYSSKEAGEQAKAQKLIARELKKAPLIIENILGFSPSQEQYQVFLLDGYKGNRHYDTIKNLLCEHIPKGSRANEYIAAYKEYRPTDVIVIGPRGDGACSESFVQKHTKMDKVVPDCRYHYLAYYRGMQVTPPPLTSAMLLKAANGDADADRNALRLLEVIRGQSLGRHMLACASDYISVVGGSIKRNDLGLLPAHGMRKDLDAIMRQDLWPIPKSCQTVMADFGFSEGCTHFGCDQSLKSDAELASHIFATHYDKGNPLKCPLCGEIIATSGVLRSHLAKEVGINLMACQDASCKSLEAHAVPRVFNQGRMKEHVYLCHPDKQSPEELVLAEKLKAIRNRIAIQLENW